MVSSQYEAILRDFGTYFNCNLAPDSNNTCKVALNNYGIAINLEIYSSGRLLISTRLGVIQGRYSTNIIQQALKANDLYNPSTGIFALSGKYSELVLYTFIDIDLLSPDKISTLMPPFLNKAKVWADAIKSGNIPTLDEDIARPVAQASSPFGLR